jgi:hypothetical protein
MVRVTVRIAAPEGFRPGCWLSSGTLHASALPAQGADATVDAHYSMEGDRKAALKSASLGFRGAGEARFAADQYTIEFRGLPPGMYVRSMRSGSGMT